MRRARQAAHSRAMCFDYGSNENDEPPIRHLGEMIMTGNKNEAVYASIRIKQSQTLRTGR